MTRFYIEGVEARAECCAATVRRLQQGDPQRISDCDVVRMTGETISADTEHEIWLDRTESPGDLAGSLPRVGGGQTEGSGSATVVDPPTRIREPVPRRRARLNAAADRSAVSSPASPAVAVRSTTRQPASASAIVAAPVAKTSSSG